MDILKLVKKQFQKFGLSEKSLKELANLVDNSLSSLEDITEEQAIEQIKTYEPIAKSFQSEVERRFAEAKKRTNGEENGSDIQESEEQGSAGARSDDKVIQLLNQALNRLDNIERGNSVKANNQVVTEKLKELKLSDKEIEAVMFGRSFEKAEDVDAFVEKQAELYQDITAERSKSNAGNGFTPPSSSGNYTKKQIDNDVEEFNKQF